MDPNPPQSPAQQSEKRPIHLVQIFHPGYTDHALLLTLNADESGLSHANVLTACQIIAGNRWDGFLSETYNGIAVLVPLSGRLCGLVYFFHVPGETMYPVVPRFRDWIFPHDNLPPIWSSFATEGTYGSRRSSPGTATVIARRECHLSAAADELDLVRLVPNSESEWFFLNSMNKYVIETTHLGFDAMDDAANQVFLHLGLHNLFDMGCFFMSPCVNDDMGNTDLVVYTLTTFDDVDSRLCKEICEPHCGVSVEYLFARFAWVIFKRVTPFLTNYRKRRLTTRGDGCDSAYTTATYSVMKEHPSQGSKPNDADNDANDDELDGY
ncbi:hypothetical protein SLS58_007146 [Diplodia intermedia]|uniref:HNH nuclease domain-containing protein n=1 Tax=Diplodia intermedia TaxID=856260 RepID=A0ABR3TKX8_9PEZI